MPRGESNRPLICRTSYVIHHRMRIVRFSFSGRQPQYGILEADRVRPLRAPPFGRLEPTGERIPLSEAKLAAPVLPSKVVAIGLNYRDHAGELGLPLPEEPMLFLKPGTAVIGPGEKIVCPEMSSRVDYEGELAVVIGRKASRVEREQAGAFVLGYTCLNDVTARDLQFKDVQYTRAKGFDTFAPLGPWIETELDPCGLTVESYLNGERKQSSNTSQLVFDAFYLVHFASWVMTLNPGDVIATGTPSGIGPMQPGDRIEVRIQGIGSLINEVVRPG
jgi:2-keto-4-pentenoate hydratase/2-oxohepta-3-ene-1,7-dioic acid hydratase in catechol pathway